MAKVSISEAARQAGITRQYFYKKYIDTGKISVEKDAEGKNPQIDTAEFYRVFGKLLVDSHEETHTLQEMTQEDGNKIAFLEEKLQFLSEQLVASQEREKIANARENRLLDQIDLLTDQLATTTKLLEHKAAPEPVKKRWWPFS